VGRGTPMPTNNQFGGAGRGNTNTANNLFFS